MLKYYSILSASVFVILSNSLIVSVVSIHVRCDQARNQPQFPGWHSKFLGGHKNDHKCTKKYFIKHVFDSFLV